MLELAPPPTELQNRQLLADEASSAGLTAVVLPRHSVDATPHRHATALGPASSLARCRGSSSPARLHRLSRLAKRSCSRRARASTSRVCWRHFDRKAQSTAAARAKHSERERPRPSRSPRHPKLWRRRPWSSLKASLRCSSESRRISVSYLPLAHPLAFSINEVATTEPSVA